MYFLSRDLKIINFVNKIFFEIKMSNKVITKLTKKHIVFFLGKYVLKCYNFALPRRKQLGDLKSSWVPPIFKLYAY